MARGDVEVIPAGDSIVKAEAKVDKGDILAIGVCQAESWLNEQLVEARARRDSHVNALTQTKKAINKACQAAAGAQFKKRSSALEKACQGLSLKTFKMQITHPNADDLITVVQNLEGKRWDRKVDVTLKAELGSRGYGGDTCTEVLVLSADIAADVKDAIKTLDYIDVHKTSVRGFTHKLTRMPTLERQLRANMAAQTLSETVGGKKLLAAVTRDIIKKVKALPAPSGDI